MLTGYVIAGKAHGVCVQEVVGDYVISLSLDDSCGALSNFGRGEVKVYGDLTMGDVTMQVFGAGVYGGKPTIESLEIARQWAMKHSGESGN